MYLISSSIGLTNIHKPLKHFLFSQKKMNTYLSRLVTSPPVCFNINETIRHAPRKLFELCTNFNKLEVVNKQVILSTDLRSFDYLVEILMEKQIFKFKHQESAEEYVEIEHKHKNYKLQFEQSKKLLDLGLVLGALEVIHTVVYYMLTNYNSEVEKYLISKRQLYPIMSSCMMDINKSFPGIIKVFKQIKACPKILLQIILMNKNHKSYYQNVCGLLNDPVMNNYMNILKNKFTSTSDSIILLCERKKYEVDVKSETVSRKNFKLPLRLFIESYWFDVT